MYLRLVAMCYYYPFAINHMENAYDSDETEATQ